MTAKSLPKNIQTLYGYTKCDIQKKSLFNLYFNKKYFILFRWYRELCLPKTEKDWQPLPSQITTKTRVTPSLLRLTWKGKYKN